VSLHEMSKTMLAVAKWASNGVHKHRDWDSMCVDRWATASHYESLELRWEKGRPRASRRKRALWPCLWRTQLSLL